jgi:OmpA-OmpF porin, OOP family
MRRFAISVCVVLAFALAGLGGARAQDWLLNGGASHFYMETAKAGSIVEVHQFTGLDGRISRDGNASVDIDLLSVQSGVDVRDVRMRFLLFETYKFPKAEVRARLDMPRIESAVLSSTRTVYPLRFNLAMHGLGKELETLVYITRLTDKSVSVATVKPIVINAETFGLSEGIAKLSEAVNGTPIVTAASFTFDLVFETGERLPALEQARLEAAAVREREERRAITLEECQTRFNVISTTGAIYFRTGSAELDRQSDPLLDSVADIANRCPLSRIEVAGHTDSVGSPDANFQLSVQRARSVLAFLVQHGVPPQRITAAGYGDTRPIAPNTTEIGRSRNRRIEFRVAL